MKKIFLLIVLATLIISCSKDADDTPTGLREFKVTLKVDPNHNFGNFTETVYAFLSDQNGTILNSGELKIGQTTTLVAAGEPSAVYDLSYMRYADIDIVGEEAYTLITYTNIDQGDYCIGPSRIIEDSRDEIYLNVKNIGYPSEVTSSTAGAGTFGPENNGYYNFQGNLAGSPTSDFYISFKSPNEQFDRYFWQKDIPEGSTFEIDYNTLPEIQNVLNIQTPSNTIYGFGLEGLINLDTNLIHHGIREGNYPNGVTSLSIPVPTNVFDNYLFRISFGDNNFRYGKTINAANIPNIISTPALSFTVNNHSPANFNMSTNGDATIYNVVFRGSNANETIFVAHSIYGEVVPEVTFSKENLRKNIQQTYPNLPGFETLPLGSVSMTHYNYTNSYKEILKFIIEGNIYVLPENLSNEVVSKQFD